MELSQEIDKRDEGSVGEPFHSIEYKVEPRMGRGDNVGELFDPQRKSPL